MTQEIGERGEPGALGPGPHERGMTREEHEEYWWLNHSAMAGADTLFRVSGLPESHRAAYLEGWKARGPYTLDPSNMRRLLGLRRYGITILPPSSLDVYEWLDVLDAALDEAARSTTCSK